MRRYTDNGQFEAAGISKAEVKHQMKRIEIERTDKWHEAWNL